MANLAGLPSSVGVRFYLMVWFMGMSDFFGFCMCLGVIG